MIFKLITFVLLVQFVRAETEWYPLDKKEQTRLTLEPFKYGSKLQLECMSRNIDNGEHDADLDQNIIYVPFPTCKETGGPFLINYGVNEDLSCTISLTDELYHLFQLYLHEDAPFSCRLPISSDSDLRKLGLTVPLPLNIRGTLSESHIHIDNNINVLNIKPKNFNGLISSVGFSSGTNVTRVIIGDVLKLNFAVRWLDVDVLSEDNSYHYASGFYKLPLKLNKSLDGFTLYIIITAIISSLVTYGVIYVKFNKRNPHNYDFDPISKSE